MPRKKTSKSRKRLFRVAVMAAVRDPLTYGAPDSLEVWPGQRVMVPLGSRKVAGVVIEPVPQMIAGVEPRDILETLDSEPALAPELLTLGLWIAEYYLAPVGEVFRAMLPLGSKARRVWVLHLTDAGRERLEEIRSNLLAEIREGDEANLLAYLAAHPGAALETVRKFSGPQRQIVTGAIKQGWITTSSEERERRKVLAVRLANPPSDPSSAETRRPSAAARRILEALRDQQFARDHRQLLNSADATLETLRRLERQGFVDLFDSRTGLPREMDAPSEWATRIASSEFPASLTLTTGQSSALEAVFERLGEGQFRAILLHGITGSGKTEIYLRLVAACLDRGKSALLLVPEIALTPLVRTQFIERFGGQVALLHSGLTDAERRQEWWRIWRGEAHAVLGTRSAIFAPLSNLGLVIVDEEHEASYKQQETPRYHGRDVAVVRARLAKALLVLGSATPSLESYWNAQQGKYQLLTLTERVQGRRLAEVEIVDMRQEFRETHTQAPVSRRLHQEIEAQLRAGAQTMILLNRRGYSWFLLCRSCGEAVTCINCSISLTYHRGERRLICHYCGYATSIPAHCPACGSEYLQYIGEGTEKIEEKLRELFPQARVERLDRDVAGRAGRYLRVLSDFRAGKIDILAGTQLIAKGHDFPGVTLVGVVSADMGLRLPDFRAAERTFQLLTQAAGRAGRGETPGRVLVQTFYPEHYAVRLAADQNYPGFFSKEMGFRRMMHYPPTTALAHIIAQDEKLERAAEIAHDLGQFITEAADERQIRMLGPNPAPLARVEKRYRIQILLKANSRTHLNRVLRHMADECDRRHIPSRSVMIDVDPASIM